MKFREIKDAATEVAAIPQKINAMVALSFLMLIIATAALVVTAIRSK